MCLAVSGYMSALLQQPTKHVADALLQVQVQPWFTTDCELADIINERFGHVSYAAIDLDTDVNYPKGD